MRHISEAKNKLALSGLTNDKFIVMEDMSLETRKGDVKFLMGEEIMLGTDGENLIVRDPSRSYLVEDHDIALEIINNTACKEEMSDLQYKKMTFLEAKSLRVETADLIKTVADSDEIRNALKDAKKRKEALFEMKKTGVELPVVIKESKLSIEDKVKKIFENKLSVKKPYLVEAVEIRENPSFAKNLLALDGIKVLIEEAKKEHENVESADEFISAANDAEAVVDVNKEDGEMVAKKGEAVIGYFDPNAGAGVIFKAGSFDNVDAMKDALKDAGISLKSEIMLDALFDGSKEDEVEKAIEDFKNSDKKEESYNKCKKVLVNCGMSDEIAANVVECFK